MPPVSVRELLSPDGTRKVVIYRRPNGTYGFEERVFQPRENAWLVPGGRRSYPVLATAQHARAGASARVPWLAALIRRSQGA